MPPKRLLSYWIVQDTTPDEAGPRSLGPSGGFPPVMDRLRRNPQRGVVPYLDQTTLAPKRDRLSALQEPSARAIRRTRAKPREIGITARADDGSTTTCIHFPRNAHTEARDRADFQAPHRNES